MAEDAAAAAGPRRSSRARKAVQRFEDTAYAADILHTQLRNADTFEDFMATLFLCFKPACYRPDLWKSNKRSEHRAIYMLTLRHAKAVRIDPDVIMNLANDFACNQLDTTALMNVLNASTWEHKGVVEFLRTIDVRPEGFDMGEDDDDEEDNEGDDDDPDDPDEEEHGEEEEEDDEEDEDEDEEEEEEEAVSNETEEIDEEEVEETEEQDEEDD